MREAFRPGVRGFPAHAGMDLSTCERFRRCRRFPRPRGDGPSKAGTHRSADPVSPPTRGWTRSARIGAAIFGGFPAHAGMDPTPSRSRPSSTRFPRPRGDGPRSRFGGGGHGEVSPPTRGWTLDCSRRKRRYAGFPAHAGMDPTFRKRSTSPIWFPRPRGDGPECLFTTAYRMKVSPPTRGWTSRGGSRDRRADGFPPPTRGWTPKEVARLVPRVGFPAHAGMDPLDDLRPNVTYGFPRPRGDGPT